MNYALPGNPLARRLVDMCTALRQHGLPIGTSDIADAGRAIEVLGLQDRDRLRAGLAAAVLRRGGQRAVFDQVFDVYFPVGIGARNLSASARAQSMPAPLPAQAQAAHVRAVAQEFRELLLPVLATGKESALQQLAAQALEVFGRISDEQPERGFSALNTWERLSPQLALARAAELLQDGPESGGQSGGSGSGAGGAALQPAAGGTGGGLGGRTSLSHHLAVEQVRRHTDFFRQAVESEARRRNAELRGVDSVVRYAVAAPIERTSFLFSYSMEAAELRRIVSPLARKLAARMAARRRRSQRGSVDVRRTLRLAMGTGGVPMHLAYKRPHPGRPDIVVLADMSASVAGFSRFTILLMQALSAQFTKMRMFGFINRCEEITDVVKAAGLDGDLLSSLKPSVQMTRGHTNSDYGAMLADFSLRFGDAITESTTLLILGDARSNHTNPRAEILQGLVHRAKTVAWLNPESHGQWGAGDSEALRYGQLVDMHECCNIEQLRMFVSRDLA